MPSELAPAKAIHIPLAVGEPPSDWRWSRLDDACHGVFDCPHSTPKLQDAGPYVVRTQDIISGVFRADQAAHVSEETYTERIARVTPSRGDLLYSREGTYFGIAAEVPEGTRVCLGQRMVLIRPNADTVDFRFLRHWLNSPIMASHIHGYRDGTVAERLNLPTIRALPILLPPLSIQDAIARILGSLERKIELNRRMNATLEAMARALFQSWFVDFDPVHAKQQGRQPAGMDDVTANLFPADFQQTSLGAIPSGWNLGPLYSVARFINGAAFKSADFCDPSEGLPVVKIAELKDGISPQTKFSARPAVSDQMIETGELLYSWSGSPDTSLDAFLWTQGQGLLNQHIFKVETSDITRKRYVYYLLKHLRPVLVETARDKQTTGLGHVTVADMNRLQVCNPPDAVLMAFDKQVAAIFDMAFANVLQSRTLAALRDALLPKLLSGELKAGAV